MSQKEVDAYLLELPSTVAEKWVRAHKPALVMKRLNSGPASLKFSDSLHRLEECGLAACIPENRVGFYEVLLCLLEYLDWIDERTQVAGLAPYLEVCAKYRLSNEFLDLIPIRLALDNSRILVSRCKWDQIVTAACENYEDGSDAYAVIAQSVRTALEERNINVASVASPKDIRIQQELSNACPQIQNTDCLSPREKLHLHHAVGAEPTDDALAVLNLSLIHI